jgi:hypothetical protein
MAEIHEPKPEGGKEGNWKIQYGIPVRIHTELTYGSDGSKRVTKRLVHFSEKCLGEGWTGYNFYYSVINYVKHRLFIDKLNGTDTSHFKLNFIRLEYDGFGDIKHNVESLSEEIPYEYTPMSNNRRVDIISKLPGFNQDNPLQLSYFSYCYDFIEGNPVSQEIAIQDTAQIVHDKLIDCARRNYPYWQRDNDLGNFIEIDGQYEFLDIDTVNKAENMNHFFIMFKRFYDIIYDGEPFFTDRVRVKTSIDLDRLIGEVNVY